MKKNQMFLFFIVFISTSCNHPDRIFPYEKKLVGTQEGVKFISYSFDVKEFENYIVINDFKNEKFTFHIFDKTTFNYIKSCGSKGKGPDEILHPLCFARNCISNLCVFDPLKTRLSIYDIDNCIKSKYSKPEKIIEFESSNIKNLSYSKLYWFDNLNDTTFLFIGNFEKDRLRIFNSHGQLVNSIGNYAAFNYNKLPLGLNNYLANGLISLKPDKSKVAIVLQYYNAIEIYSLQNNEQKFISIGELQINRKSVQPINWTRTYIGIYTTDKYIYALYNGFKIEDKQLEGKEIHVLSWDGQIIGKYILDYPISTFFVDEQKGLIYCHSNYLDVPFLTFSTK